MGKEKRTGKDNVTLKLDIEVVRSKAAWIHQANKVGKRQIRGSASTMQHFKRAMCQAVSTSLVDINFASVQDDISKS